MHMSDALLSTPVALTAGVAAAGLIIAAGSQLKKSRRDSLVPLMGVMGAFVFAAQMVNFAIPGTGSSGHIVGGVLLAAMLGPWAAFVTLASVLIIQCLIFADGGLMALGCNIINMAALTSLVAYPLVYRPIAGRNPGVGRVMTASIAACVAGLELGAVAVTVETSLSGVTALPFSEFLLVMTAIHLAIGTVEGVATGAVLSFVMKSRPSLLYDPYHEATPHKGNVRRAVVWLAVATVAIAGGLSFLASSDPDGLEWSIARIAGDSGLQAQTDAIAATAQRIQSATSIMPDYDNSLSGIIGAVMVVALVWVVTTLVASRRKAAVVPRAKNDHR